MKLPFDVDKTWTLFLDRDGVINLHYPNDYVKSVEEFIFLEGALDAIRDLSRVFKRIIVVTNQQGVGKGLMSEADLDLIHETMRKEVRKYGGCIHAIYAATGLASENDIMRKPNIGMALKAKKDFQGLDLTKSVMVGDSVTDLEFGRNAGMKTVFISQTEEDHPLADITVPSLIDFANLICNR
ncbi:MAG: HAD family hydrolase [Chitinophagales bacterium]|nr:HAD family hydrolase [Chitinophagales bacterium]